MPRGVVHFLEEMVMATDDDRIVAWADYGQHIALTCKNHPDLRWSTKNIDYIGARHIFFLSKGMECDCPVRDLHVVEPPGAQ